MPNDAKLGLIVGVAVVLVISVVFYRKEPVPSASRGAEPAAAAVGSSSTSTTPPHNMNVSTRGRAPEAGKPVDPSLSGPAILAAGSEPDGP